MTTKTLITEKVNNIYNAVKSADAILVDGGIKVDIVNYCVPCGDPDQEVLFLEWVNSAGVRVYAKFTEEGIEESFVDRTYPDELILIDSEGEEVPITLLKKSAVTNLVHDYER